MKTTHKMRTLVLASAAILVAAAIILVSGITPFKLHFAAPAKNGAGAASGTGDRARYASLKASDFDEVVVKKATDQRVIEASGNLSPARSADLAFSISGTVASVAAREGAYVKTGEVLARLDDTDQRYKVADVENRLQKAEISGNIKDAGLIALELDLRKADLAKAALRAPYAGVVSDVAISVGDATGASVAAVRIIDRSYLIAMLEIDEIDLPVVRTGQKALFEVDALPGKEYEGKVSSIPPEGRVTSQGLAVFDVEARIDNPPPELLPAYSFSAKVIASTAREILTLPKAAVTETPRGTMVIVKESDGSIGPRQIEANKLADGSWEIVSGLAEGDTVLVQKAAARSSGNSGLPFMMMGPGGPPPGGRDRQDQGQNSGGTQRSSGPSGSTNRGGNP